MDKPLIFPPPPQFQQQANVQNPEVYHQARANTEKFWANFATELHWFKPWERLLVWEHPHARWFVGGKLNVAYNCLDRNLAQRGEKTALLWEGEPGDTRRLSYRELHQEVGRWANALLKLGVKKGDRVGIYLPMIPELPIAMLACARIGAVHSVVFGGFSAEALADRLNDAGTRLLITADGGYRRGDLITLKANADQALERAPGVEKVIVVPRAGKAVISFTPGRDLPWLELREKVSSHCPAAEMDAEDSLFILYTSGTTGKPKGIVHATGGYLVGVYATTQWVFDLKDADIYWCTADMGWVTGHSYGVYGPLACGATVFMYEGAPDYPQPDRIWTLIEQYGITIFYTAPTAIRSLMRYGEAEPRKHNLSSLRLLGTVGEPINSEAWLWFHRHIGGNHCPIVDTWWQTETGMIMLTPLPGITPLKPGSAGLPFPGVEADVVDETGRPVSVGQSGFLVIKSPWPAMLRTIHGDPQRYERQYWSQTPPFYFSGDNAMKDEEGYFWLLGRMDDVIKVAGHRLSTAELESAIMDHPQIVEAAVIGKAHQVKGQAISAFVVAKDQANGGSLALAQEIKALVARKIGPIARPDDVTFVAELPKTRSGKIMRRLLRDIAEGKVLGDISTLADPCTVAELKKDYERKGGY